MASIHQSRRPVNPAKVHDIACLCRPIAPCTLAPHGRTGAVRVNGECYVIGYNAERRRGKDVVIHGYFLTKGDGTRYDLDAHSCTCADCTYRARTCKHLQAIEDLLAHGDLAEIDPPAPVVMEFEDP